MAKLSELYERLRELYQFKHKASRDRRLTKIEREIGSLKVQIRKEKEWRKTKNIN